MKTSNLRATAAAACLAAVVSACGGNVDLGRKASPPPGAAGSTQASDPADSPAGERVLNRPDILFMGLMAAGDYLYFVGSAATASSTAAETGIYRCRTSDCKGTFALFVSGNIGFPQAFGDRLGFMSWDDTGYGFTTVALSDGKDEQAVIRGLPGGFEAQPFFYADFVYFSLAVDRGLYRCSLPTCAEGPQRLTRTNGSSPITTRAEADYLLWSDGSFIYRAAGYGTEPAIALLPDDSLSEAPVPLNPNDSRGDAIDAIDASNGMLYASVGRSSDGQGCDSFCPHDVVAWPVRGGAAQLFLHSETRLQALRIFDNELVWMEPSTKTSNQIDASTISTCRIEACDASRRELGETTFAWTNVVADEHHLYWIEAEPIPPLPGTDVSGGFQQSQIRRAPRLPAP
jgi:hypothetical protein